jgi:hypothetical protein
LFHQSAIPGIVCSSNAPTKCQRFLPEIDFHNPIYKLVNRTGAMGCSPYMELLRINVLCAQPRRRLGLSLE